jgi:UDP-N-acetylmuramoyl-tripeptide--D-alanyl-D-alanine ligase
MPRAGDDLGVTVRSVRADTDAPAASGRWRSAVDGIRLVWPVTGAYRILVRRAVRHADPMLRRIARAHRRTLGRSAYVVAVVGSVGKSTTRRTVAAALGDRPMLEGTSNFGARLAMSVLRVRPRHREAVFEVGIAHPGQMRSLARMVLPNLVVVTAIASDHNRSLRTLDVTRAEKAQMLHVLPADGIAVLNGDDPNVRWMATQTNARVVTFGFGPDNDVRASDVCVTEDARTRFTLHAGGRRRDVALRLLGTHMVYPALAAVAVASLRGRDVDDVISRIEAVDALPGRMQRMDLASGVTLVRDDLKASLESIVAALDGFAAVGAARRVVVLGDIDEPVGSPRPLYRGLGARLAPWADRVILIGSQALSSVVSGAVEAGMPRSALTHVGSSVGDAVELLQKELAPGDAVLIKGRTTQRLERVSLALSGRTVRCPARVCQVSLGTQCAACPMLTRDAPAFDNVHLQPFIRL